MVMDFRKSHTLGSRQSMYGNILVGLSFMALTFLTVKTFAPDIKSNAETQNISDNVGPYTMSISSDSLTSINITPTASQAVYTGTNAISYTNTCPHGMNVTMSSASEKTSLTRTGSDSGIKTIPTISSGTALADNTWGFSKDNGSTYNAVPALANPTTIIDTNSATTTTATLNLIYGVKTDNQLPSGSYLNDIVYTVSAKQQCLSYGITWDLDGGTAATGVTYPTSLNFSQTVDLASLTPSRDGYEFTGWSNGTNTFDGTETAADINPTNAPSLTMTAQWEPTQYSITYNLDGGSVATANPASYTIETNTFTLNNPAKNGNAFLGWSNDTADWSDTEIHHETRVVDAPQIQYSDTENFYYGPYYKAPVGYYRLDVYGTSLNNANIIRVYEWTVSGNVNMIDKKLVDNTHLIIFIEITSDANVNGVEAIIGGNITITKEEIRSIKDSTSIPKGSTGNKAYTANWNTNMQLFSCNTLSSGSSITLTDTRDNNTYVVKKLADGRCWMTENLRLINKTISSSDSNLPSGETYTVPASDVSSFTESYNTNSAYLDSTHGGYYNFYTATAGWGTNSVKSGNAPKDICPRGWRLPTGGDTGEFNTLYGQYNSVALMMNIPNFTLSGNVYNGSVYSQGSYGYFWSSTVRSANYAYYLSLDSSNVNPANVNHKRSGFSVRCVAMDTMQNFDKSTLSAAGDEVRLIDVRDKNVYTVKKLADGNVWMTENLRITGKTITSADSNVTSDFAIPASSTSGFNTQDTNNAYVDSTYGGYYTFYTATAGTGGTSLASGNAPSSICPKGWRLPTGGSSGEFQTLYNNYNSSALMQGEPNFTLSGYPANGSVYNQGSYGIFWSSTAGDANYAYDLYLDSSYVYPVYDHYAGGGFSVRCVAI